MKTLKYLLITIFFGVSLGFFSTASADSTLDGLNAAAKPVGAYTSQVNDNKTAREIVLNKVGGLVGLILSFVGIIFLLLMVYAGLQWMTSQGNSATVDKAKELMINALIGLIIVTAAYSITIFIGNELAK